MSSDDVRARLESALGAQYTLERELGGGGMSRVYVAVDATLGRRVVVKVLPPELAAAVSADRFRREIQLAARLQHPHIVPLLAAGAADELLYYTMPFVEGSSLRARLARDGPLPLGDALRLLRELADALDYAHRRGVVHRDIKPDNVLLSEGHVLVTDFGIAKALSADTSPAGGGTPTQGGLTGLGVSIGTPAYMAPEQGVADPTTDHRADIYSFGAVAYEMLAGAPPFGHDRSAHQLLMAHMMEEPVALGARRPDVPQALDALVARCLAKRPEDRPQTAADVVRALDTIVVPSGASAVPSDASSAWAGAAGDAARGGPPTGKLATGGGSSAIASPPAGAESRVAPGGRGRSAGVWMASSFALLALLGGAATVIARRGDAGAGGAAATAERRVLVAPFENQTGDRALDPVGRMAADWLTQGLAQTQLVKVVDARTALGVDTAATSSGGATGGDRTRTTARDAGATEIVAGTFYRIGDTLVFNPRLVDARTGDVIPLAMDPARGPAANPTEAIERLRRATLGALATRYDTKLAGWAGQSQHPPSYEAYQAYVAGMDAMDHLRAPDALAHFQRAAQIDTGWAQAKLWIVEALETVGRLAAADSAVARLSAARDRLTPFEQAQLDENVAYLRGDRAGDLAAAVRINQLSPTPDHKLTLAYKLAAVRRWREALDTLRVISRTDARVSANPLRDGLEHSMLHMLGRHEEELTLARALRARFPEYPSLTLAEARALVALGRTAEVQRMADSIARAPASTARGPGSITVRQALRAIAAEARAHGQAALAQRLLERTLSTYDALPADSLRLPAYARGRAQTLYLLGRYREAEAALLALGPDTTFGGLDALGTAAAYAGDRATAERVSAQVAARADRKYIVGTAEYIRAEIADALGDHEEALDLLRRAEAKGSVLYELLHTSPEFASLRNDPAFQELVKPRL
ncbi:MAG TPA: serine/threonine-protein kinase [Gemmatimonadaceae bacterium]|nr:serine/threonine-protein kinase [Gemmatimonadaceae bacterium]